MPVRVRAGLALLAVSVSLMGCSSEEPSPSASNSPSLAYVEIRDPIGVVAIDDAVWIASASDDAVVRVDRASRSETARVKVGDTPLRLAYDGRLLWVSVFGADTVVAVDPSSNQISIKVALDGQPEGLAVGFGSLWVVRQQARQLTRLGPDGKVLQSYSLGAEPRLVTVSTKYVFASNFGDGTVTRLNPTTGELMASQRLCDGAQGMAAKEGVLWLTCTKAGRLLAIDQELLTIVGSLDLTDEPDAVHIVDGIVWVAQAKGPQLVRVHGAADAPAVQQSIPVGAAGGLADRANVDFAAAGGELWVTAPQSDKVYIYPRQ